jgi:hypothetical protein
MIEDRIKEHQRDFQFCPLDCSVMAGNLINQGHQIHFEDTMALMKPPNSTIRVVCEAIETVCTRSSTSPTRKNVIHTRK